MQIFILVLLVVVFETCGSFRLASRALTQRRSVCVRLSSDESPAEAPKSKGFGAPRDKKEDAQEEKDIGTKTYESQAKRGVPEYNIFLRPQNGTDAEWVPVGSMTIPRDTKVSTAVFEVESEMLKGTFKLYPKLKAFYELRADKENAFEYGCCLKAFPDEPITILTKEAPQSRNFFTNWLNQVTSPMDTSSLESKGTITLKQ